MGITGQIEWCNLQVYIFFGLDRRGVQTQRQGSRKVAHERNRDPTLESSLNLARCSPVEKSGLFDSPWLREWNAQIFMLISQKLLWGDIFARFESGSVEMPQNAVAKAGGDSGFGGQLCNALLPLPKKLQTRITYRWLGHDWGNRTVQLVGVYLTWSCQERRPRRDTGVVSKWQIWLPNLTDCNSFSLEHNVNKKILSFWP